MILNEGEQQIYIVRKHWLVFAGQAVMIAFGAVFPYVVMRVLPFNVLLSAFPASVVGPLIAFLYISWLLLLWIALFYGWTMYYLDIWIVTNKRVCDVSQRGLFSRELLTAELDNIQDVTVDTEGLIQTLFNFGTLTIHTAGEGTIFVITNASHPIRAREKIMEEHRVRVSEIHGNPTGI